MKSYTVITLAWLLGSLLLPAQSENLARRGLPFIKKTDQQLMKHQSDDFFAAIKPLSQKLGEHAVNVYFNGQMVGRGTVLENGIVVKWSEINAKRRNISVVGHDGVKHKAYVKAVYFEYDLALLEYGGKLPPVDFATARTPDVGQFVLAVGPAKEAHGFAVVSVEPRSLRERDKAYLGVRMGTVLNGSGVLVEGVQEGTAAERAGLQRGDVVQQINGLKVDGVHEMGAQLQKLRPGDKVSLLCRRGSQEFSAVVELGARPENLQEKPRRVEQMQRMGGSLNEVAEGFPDVLQSDMQLDKEDAGGPVFDLDGNFVGVVVARASRIKTYIITADRLAEQLQKKPDMIASSEKKPAQIIEEPKQSPRVKAEIRRLKEVIQSAERRLLELESE